LVEAFNKVENENVELRIYGTYDPKSNYFKELQSMIRNDNIKFMGRYTDVREPYSEMDVLVVPSICYESYSLVVREAFICKIPVIASDIGALPEAVQNGETGLLFQAGNAIDLYEKMELIIHHPDLIEKFKTNIGPVKSIEQQAEEMEGIYLDLSMSKHE
jgi:glycosyltransferase involved in cell wall biosynthesis